MTPDELREAVARAMAEADGGTPAGTMFGGKPWWHQWLPEADAALAVVREALREPTPVMEGAGCDATYHHQDGMAWEDAARCWRAMLAASPLGDTP